MREWLSMCFSIRLEVIGLGVMLNVCVQEMKMRPKLVNYVRDIMPSYSYNSAFYYAHT